MSRGRFLTSGRGRRRGTAGPRFPKWTFVPSFVQSADSGSEEWLYYHDGDATTQTLDRGTGWRGSWRIADYDAEQSGEDSMESYADADPVTEELNGGSNWDGPWVLVSY